MPFASMIWFAGLFVASITTNTALLKIITDDKFQHPNRVSFFVNLLLSIVGGVFGLMFVGFYYSAGFVLFNAFSFLLMFYLTKKRTVYALEFGEKLLVALKTIDLQITYILSEIYTGESDDVARPIRRALRFILSELPNILGLDDTHHPQLSVLVPQNKKFRVVAYERIESFRIDKMEELFQYGSNTVSLAGHAMNQRRPVIVNDLANESDENLKFWVRTFRDEQKEGSLLAFPIIRGLGSPDAEPIAILCITSAKKDAFLNENALIRILTYFSVKIEILQNCLDLTTLSRRGV